MNNGADLLKKREYKFRGMSCHESNYTCIHYASFRCKVQHAYYQHLRYMIRFIVLVLLNLALLVIFVKKQTVRSCGKNKKKTSSSSIQTNDFDWLLSSIFESRRGTSVASWWLAVPR